MPLIELDSQIIAKIKLSSPVAVSGAAAIARGLIEANVKVVTSYPGSPCSEIIENLSMINNQFGIYIEWSANEKVAFEIATSAAMAGVRSAFITKCAGMNWAADSLMVMGHAGVNGGMVIISADDPGAFNSSIEQDTRYYAEMSKILCMEPSDPQEAKDMAVAGFNISEELNLPVLIHTTNRILYGRSKLFFGEILSAEHKVSFEKNISRWVIGGKNAVRRHSWLNEHQHQLQRITEQSEFNKLENQKRSKYGIVAVGVCYCYVKEVLKELKLENKIVLLKIASINPLPKDLIKQFFKRVKIALVVEELGPFIEQRLKAIAFDLSGNNKVKVIGRLSQNMPDCGCYDPLIIKEAIAREFKFPFSVLLSNEILSRKKTIIPSSKMYLHKQLIFCPGCPHRVSLYLLNKVLESKKDEFIIATDPGCYALGAFSPFLIGDTLFNMGASISVASGFYHAKLGKRVIALTGDATFLHGGIQALINCCSTGVDILIFILDNKTCAMTGLQPYPGVGKTANGDNAKVVNIKEMVKACGIEYAKLIDPFDIKIAVDVLAEALKLKGQRVVIAQHECAQIIKKNNEQLNEKIEIYKIDCQKCKGCRVCFDEAICTAISINDGRISINRFLCTGCGFCSQICPQDAIFLEKK